MCGVPRPVDAAGTLLIGLGLAALMAGLVEGRAGWNQPPVIALVALGLALVVAFVAVERRIMHPMLDLALFGRPDFLGATVAALASGLGVLALMSLVPTVLERGLNEGAVLAAVVLLAWSATSVVSALGARRLPSWASPRVQLVAGLVGCAAGQLALVGLTPESPIGRLLPGLLVTGAANGVLNAALGRQVVASVPADRAAMGSGANNTARYVGSGIGITIVTVLLTRSGAAPGAAGLHPAGTSRCCSRSGSRLWGHWSCCWPASAWPSRSPSWNAVSSGSSTSENIHQANFLELR